MRLMQIKLPADGAGGSKPCDQGLWGGTQHLVFQGLGVQAAAAKLTECPRSLVAGLGHIHP